MIKVDNAPNNITRVSYIEYGENGAIIRVGLNDLLQLDVNAYAEFIINEGGCGAGGNGQTDLVDAIDKAMEQFETHLSATRMIDDGIFRKIYTINNCENNVQDTNMEICDRLYRTLEGTFLQSVDRAILNVPAPSDRASNAINDNSDSYLQCLVNPNNIGQETGGICATENDGSFTSDDFGNLYLDEVCKEETICGFHGRMRPDPTQSPTERPSSDPTMEPITSRPTSLSPSLFPSVSPTKEECQYELITQSLAWFDAEAFCRSTYLGQNGHLMSIHNEAEAVLAHDLCNTDDINVDIIANGTNCCCWIGINDRVEEGTYLWSDGSPYDYSNWFDREGVDISGNDDCGA